MWGGFGTIGGDAMTTADDRMAADIEEQARLVHPIDEGRIISLIEDLTERLRASEARQRESRITDRKRCWGAGHLGADDNIARPWELSD